MAMGAALNYYTMSIFGPALIADLGWSKAEFALVGTLPLLNMLLLPLAGRFMDRFGPRAAAIVGFTSVPLGFLALSMMSGNFTEFLAINFIQNVLGILTTSLVFTRVVVDRFDAARGIALSAMMSVSPLTAAIAAPLFSEIIANFGWRAGYVCLAAMSGIGGITAVTLMGSGRRIVPIPRHELKLSPTEFLGLIRHPIFLLLVGGMFLVNFPQNFASSQLKLMGLDRGLPDQSATWLVSVYAVGVIAGRILCGLALDRFRPHLVAVATLGISAVGYLVFASHLPATALLMLAAGTIGCTMGAQSGLGAFFISRRFSAKNYGLLYSIVGMTVAASSAVGSLVLSLVLSQRESYVPFLLLAAATTIAGATLVGLTGVIRQSAGTAGDKNQVIGG